MQTKTILVVDDDQFNLDITESILTQAGYDVVKANSGAKCLEYIMLKRFDLILLDVVMPKMSGVETLKQIRMNMNTRSLPVIFLTADSSIETVKEAKKLTVCGYIVKPFLPEKLIQVVGKFFNRNVPESAQKPSQGPKTTDSVTGPAPVEAERKFGDKRAFSEQLRNNKSGLSQWEQSIDMPKSINEEAKSGAEAFLSKAPIIIKISDLMKHLGIKIDRDGVSLYQSKYISMSFRSAGLCIEPDAVLTGMKYFSDQNVIIYKSLCMKEGEQIRFSNISPKYTLVDNIINILMTIVNRYGKQYCSSSDVEELYSSIINNPNIGLEDVYIERLSFKLTVENPNLGSSTYARYAESINRVCKESEVQKCLSLIFSSYVLFTDNSNQMSAPFYREFVRILKAFNPSLSNITADKLVDNMVEKYKAKGLLSKFFEIDKSMPADYQEEVYLDKFNSIKGMMKDISKLF